MLISLFSKRTTPRVSGSIRSDYYHLERVQVENNGILQTSLQMVNVSFPEKNKQFVYTDFNLSNIIATGATNLLNPVQFANVDVDSVITDTLNAMNYAQKLDKEAQQA